MRGKGRLFVLFAVLLLAAVGAFGAIRWAQAKWLASDGPIVYIPKTIDPGIEFWEVVRQGVDAAAAELGTDVRVFGADWEKDIDSQIRLALQAIELRPKAIVLSAADYERLVPVARKIRSAGIPLILIDSGINGRYAESLVATDNFEAGRKAGDALKEQLPDGGLVGVVSFIRASSPAIEREKGVLASLREDGRYETVPTVYSDGLPDKAYEATRALLREYPGLAGIAALNEPSTVGAARAIEEAGAAGRVKLIGFDSSTDEIDYLEREVLQAIVVQKPFNMGYLAIKTAMRAYRGQKVEPLISTGSAVITKQNMYGRENQKLLFPFLGSSEEGAD
ncbi:substrate-binding domain-containing protein [Cohnella thermotolerans]|uniref:substrate-binding domain-containing protein n=1 Tax=Cohnella thermotolerans TaxID=329858 RepID=UPI000417163B|nr:substrate-binding domain-containing protein [Cohnella thermotolerans]